ncbi:SDR family oxidoreductase [Poriferisphaera sp. WC338]|uniref:SDR family oxidoreductase n=1 Tax=Poriferisphaera sp. WC338 TaxID=3425129 RepID=UPI003D8186C2
MGREPREIAITGGSGFVGRGILNCLLKKGFSVRVLARDPQKINPSRNSHDIKVVKGSLEDKAAVDELVEGVWGVIHLVGIILEQPRKGVTFESIHEQGTRQVLEAAQAAGVNRWIQMSAIGARPCMQRAGEDMRGVVVSRYHQTKWAAEQLVRESGLRWTIVRPSLIHGLGGEFMEMVKGFVSGVMPPMVPYFGRGLLGLGGGGKVEPVWVEDVVEVFARALDCEASEGEVFELGGGEVLDWPTMYRVCMDEMVCGRRKPVVAVPMWLGKGMARSVGILERLPVIGGVMEHVLPFNWDQVVMAGEDNVARFTERERITRVFDVSPKGFAEALRGYAGEMG